MAVIFMGQINRDLQAPFMAFVIGQMQQDILQRHGITRKGSWIGIIARDDFDPNACLQPAATVFTRSPNEPAPLHIH